MCNRYFGHSVFNIVVSVESHDFFLTSINPHPRSSFILNNENPNSNESSKFDLKLLPLKTMSIIRILSLLVFFTALGACEAIAQGDPISAFQLKWQNSKEYLIDIAQIMPAEQYDYKPTERQMTFREQLLHIRKNMLWLSGDFIAGEAFEDEVSGNFSKEETIDLLVSAFDSVHETAAKMDEKDLAEITGFGDGTKTKLQILNLIQDHVTHHRGQLIVYLNLQGIEPPPYVGW